MKAARRHWLQQALAGTAAAVAAPLFVRHARAADAPRFALGVASGQPQPQGMVLWTMLTAPDLPAQAEVRWEVAEDEAFTRIAARGTETAVLEDAHSVHAEPGGLQPERGYFYRFEALGQRSPVGRTRTAPAPDARVQRLHFVTASCQRFDVGHYAAWRHAAAEAPDLVLFLGDYIYEYGRDSSPADAPRRHEGGKVRTLTGYRARYAQYKSDPALQAAHAAAPWLLIWDDHEVDNDYAGLQGQDLQPDFAAQRAAAYQAYWEFLPWPKAARPVGGAMRITGRLDWGRLARFHLLDTRQHRDAQACPRPGRGGSNTVDVAECPALLARNRSLLGAAQEQWLAEGWALDRPWNLLAQQTLMARCSWTDPAGPTGGRYWTEGWDGYAATRARLLGTAAERGVPGLVSLGGDVHTHYVAELKADYDDAKAPVIGSEFVGTSISSLGLPQSRLDTLRPVNPHLLHVRGDQRGYQSFVLEPGRLKATLQAVSDARLPESALVTQARFVVEAGRPTPQREG
jgi:alkaline phosphatase D